MILAVAAVAARADVELTLRTTKGKATSTEHLTLARTWFRIDRDDGVATYDFAARRIIRVDKAKHQLWNDSLFADVDGRDHELENRTFLGGALDAGGVKDNPMSLTLAEHQLSMRRDSARAAGIEPHGEHGGTRYLWNGKELMAWSSELVPVKAAERDRFVSFVRYQIGGHPAILADLQRLDGIPKWLSYSPQLGEPTRIDVLATAQKPDAPPPAPAPDAKEALEEPQMAAARGATPESRDAAVAALIREASAAAESKKFLQALLGFVETNLMSGRPLPPEFFPYKEAITADGDARAFLAAMNPLSEDAAKVAVQKLAQLQLAAGPKAYVVSIFRADVEMKLGDMDAATRDFRTALAKNALITGVWKDLGDVLTQTYRPYDAWRCYETARRIAPEHSMLKEVAKTEAKLLREHPEYF